MLKGKIALVLLMILFTGISFAESSRQLDKDNEFGGYTWETSYNKGDRFYKDNGILKSIAFYDSKQKMRVAEYFYTEDFQKQKGLVHEIQFFNEQQKVTQMKFYYTKLFGESEGYTNKNDTFYPNSDPLATEYYYTEDFSKKYGYYHSITQFNIGHYIREWQYDYTEVWAKKIGYAKRIDHYVYVGTDKKETVTEKLYLDKDGKELKRENLETNQ